jgi:hypothetical protein
LDEFAHELRPGDFISVVRTNGESVSGRLQRVGDADLEVQTEGPQSGGQPRRRLEVTIPLGAVRSVERRRDSTRNGTLIGAAVGAGVGFGFLIRAGAVDANEADEWAAGYLAFAGVTTGVGALAGWAIDAARSRPHIRFDAPPRQGLTIRPVPLLARGSGVALAVSF